MVNFDVETACVKVKKLRAFQLFTFTYAAHTSSLFYLRTQRQLNSRQYARKIYATVEIHPKQANK